MVEINEAGRNMAGQIRSDASCKGETRIKTLVLSTLQKVIGFPTDVKAAQQSESVDCAVKISKGVGISDFSFSIMSANMKHETFCGEGNRDGFELFNSFQFRFYRQGRTYRGLMEYGMV